MPATSMEELVSLCKRRGFIFQGSEIYGAFRVSTITARWAWN